MLLLDTNALIWLDAKKPELGRRARQIIDRNAAAGSLCFSAVSVWELAILVRKLRYKLDRPVARWRNDLLDFGLKEIALDGLMAGRSEDFINLHHDPADRFIAATVDQLNAMLMTSDERLLVWAGSKGVDARL